MEIKRNRKRWVAVFLTVCLGLNGWFGTVVPQVSAASVGNADHIVISQIYAGGTDNPSKGASAYTNDYIELYNPTDYPVTLTGWSIQYVPYTYSAGSNWNVIELGTGPVTAIQPHGYYLIKGYHGNYTLDPASKTVDNPDTAADTGQFPHMSKDGGVVALVKDSAAPLTADSPAGGSTVDFVGYGTSSKTPKAYEGASFAPDGSYKKAIVRKGVNTETHTVVAPVSSSSTGYGNGYDSDNNDLTAGSGSGDFQQMDSGLFAPRNSEVREPAIKGAANAAIEMDSDNRTILSSSNQAQVDLSIGTVRNGVLTEGTDYTINGLPAGSFTSTGVGSSSDNSITIVLSGTADEALTADVDLTVTVKGAALETPGSYPDSDAIGGIKLAHASAVPKVGGAVVAGMDKLVMSGDTEIGQGTFAVQLSDKVHVRPNDDTAPYVSGTDYTVTGLPAGLELSAKPDSETNRIIFTVTNPSQVSVAEDASLSIVIKGNAVQEAGAADSDPIVGVTLQRFRMAVDTTDSRRAFVEQTIKESNSFFADPLTKAYKYSTDAVAHDAFTFLRGSADVFYRDLGTSVLPLPASLAPFSGVLTYSEGDAHFQNVGFYNDSAGTPVFGLNDFDSARVDAFYTDLLRFVTSMYVVRYEKDSAAISQSSDAEIRSAAKEFLDTYKDTVLSTVGHDDQKRTKLTANTLQAYTLKAMNAVVGGKSYEEARKSLNTKWIKDTVTSPDTSKYETATSEEIADIQHSWSDYVQGIASDPASPFHSLSASELDGYFTVKSVVRRINQGLGSIGSKRYNVLIEGPTASSDDDVILDVKQQLRDASLSKKAYQAMVPDPDIYLGVLDGSDAQYLIREISPYKGDYSKKTFVNLDEFSQYSVDSAKAYAYMQVYSSSQVNSGFADTFSTQIAPVWDVIEAGILNAAEDYSHQIVADYNLVKDDMVAGKLIDVATLDSLTVDNGVLIPDFTKDSMDYQVKAAEDAANVEITAAATDKLATISLDGNSYLAGQPVTVPLASRETNVAIVVTAQDGATTKTYTLHIRKGSAVVSVTGITVTGEGGATGISTNRGTLQMKAEVMPADAADAAVVWSVENGTGSATISDSGLLTAAANGTVTVRATAHDGSGISGTTVITLTGQGDNSESSPTPTTTPTPTPTVAPTPTPPTTPVSTSTSSSSSAATPTVTPTASPAPTASSVPTSQPTIAFKAGVADAGALKSAIARDMQTASVISFRDVPESSWSAFAVGVASQIGFVKGYGDGTFHPNADVTRAEFATMLVSALGLKADGSDAFTDTKGHWAAEAIHALQASGLAGGYTDGSFKPDRKISRAEIIAILARTVSGADAGSNGKFTDVKGHWAEGAINSLANAGIIKGDGAAELNPNANASRAESVIMIVRMLNTVLGLGLSL
ncbi:DUF2252 family protein [Paenibacillus sp. HN-1]|uniref:DUF2252 family protein n=1 Tax=Paenibacillus TaxID=44249 RepID=UPI001CA88E86|nr:MULTISPECIES: DUF2252 family protein [Paenibacillus]MBY9081184.1 DUF2252 family protein [Paenibacillus sp. CGMCC 1.18879]MBY9087221.1 DUF2252 family protein [Paenibacillus sinensis]